MRDSIFTCAICGQKHTGYPNNAEPVVTKGQCCDECSVSRVIPERIRQMMTKRV